jgi:hypothetical protein
MTNEQLEFSVGEDEQPATVNLSEDGNAEVVPEAAGACPCASLY